MASSRLRAPDGVTVAYRLLQRPGHDTLLVICPGFFQSKDTDPFRRMAKALSDRRDVLSLDFRGHGESSGWFTFSAKESAELAAVLDWARPRYARLVVMGFSLGAATAINTVSRSSQSVVGVIAVSSPAAFEDIEFRFWSPEAIRCGIRGLGRGVGCRPGSPFLPKSRPVERVGSLKGIPLLFVHGTSDAIVGVGHSRRLFAAASEPKQLAIIQKGSHAEALFRDDPRGFLALIEDWLERLPSSHAPA